MNGLQQKQLAWPMLVYIICCTIILYSVTLLIPIPGASDCDVRSYVYSEAVLLQIAPRWLEDFQMSVTCTRLQKLHLLVVTQIAKFMRPTLGPSRSCRLQMGPMNLAIRVTTGAMSIASYQLSSRNRTTSVAGFRVYTNLAVTMSAGTSFTNR